MFRTIIIEDETLAANRLATLIGTYDNQLEVVTKLPSIRSSVQWLEAHPQPDLIFMDIHLEDGLSFAIAEQVEISAPIILTTAFDDELIKTFSTKCFACLLKPINKNDLANVLDAFMGKTSNRR